VYQDQRDEAKGKALADFISWAITDGQAVAEELEYAKLPQEVVKVNEANLTKLSFKGKPLVASK
jgi:phosphate transport system substrate-binding protein